nr:MAG TPA: hypothetical protein [Caudoviricetes sp.]
MLNLCVTLMMGKNLYQQKLQKNRQKNDCLLLFMRREQTLKQNLLVRPFASFLIFF